MCHATWMTTSRTDHPAHDDGIPNWSSERPHTTSTKSCCSAAIPSSTDLMSAMARLQVGHHAGALLHLQHREHPAESEPDRQAQRQVEDLVVGELRVQTLVELVVETLVVDREPLGVLDRHALALGVAGPRPPLVEMAVVVVGDSGVEHR